MLMIHQAPQLLSFLDFRNGIRQRLIFPFETVLLLALIPGHASLHAPERRLQLQQQQLLYRAPLLAGGAVQVCRVPRKRSSS